MYKIGDYYRWIKAEMKLGFVWLIRQIITATIFAVILRIVWILT